MPVNRRKKHVRNITGLRNQCQTTSETLLSGPKFITPEVEQGSLNIPAILQCKDNHDKSIWKDDDNMDSDSGMEDSERNIGKIGTLEEHAEEIDEWGTQEEHGDEGLYIKPMTIAIQNGNDPCDEDWIPENERKKKRVKKARPTEYIKGPDIGSKSMRTQRRYRKLLQGQTALDRFGFSTTHHSKPDLEAEVDSETPATTFVRSH